MRIINLEGTHINADRINSYFFTEGTQLHVSFKGGRVSKIIEAGNRAAWYRDELSGAHYVKQAIPCVTPTWSVWKDTDGSHFATPVTLLGLCADGEVRALDLVEGAYAIVDGGSFVGLYCEDDLQQFEPLDRETRA